MRQPAGCASKPTQLAEQLCGAELWQSGITWSRFWMPKMKLYRCPYLYSQIHLAAACSAPDVDADVAQDNYVKLSSVICRFARPAFLI